MSHYQLLVSLNDKIQKATQDKTPQNVLIFPFPVVSWKHFLRESDEKSEILHPVFDFNFLLSYRLLVPPYPK